jgi:hypothetical protein
MRKPTSNRDNQIEELVVALSMDTSKRGQLPPAPDSKITLLKYQAANDNTERAWLRWLWLALIFSVPISFAIAIVRMALGLN